ncbi:AfsR/SARP family transcriptional regulator [Allokutzneria oryzae]|uniref:BTAD domain-containing putative transcriptional regulator n=1 Tax=Allokutzneria oryzae TaxID=1378989 RepID=A0ABV6A0F6_9PSEU
MDVFLGVLGPMRAEHAGAEIDLGHARQRCVLAVLVAEANHVVSLDTLAERVWGERQPQRAHPVLRSYLSRLRSVLPGVFERRTEGYVLSVEDDAIDLLRFRTLVDAARSRPDEEAAELYEQALRLWRGEPFDGLDVPWLATLRGRLAAERMAAELDQHDVLLRTGRHGELIPRLAERTAEHPLDERLAAQYMVALYRNGRPADALEHYGAIRARLAEELGSDPTAPLRRLHQQILSSDTALDLDSPQRTDVAAVVPRQLPAAPRLFAGRVTELDLLDGCVDATGTVVVSAVSGSGGVGKTWLALHWAHRNLDRFPDGQLYVNLRGFDPSGVPVAPDVVARGFLDALGVEPGSVPVEPDARFGLYRSLIAGRRMLVVLDNAADTAQVEPLLPGTPTCTVLVTSRRTLAGLTTAHGARTVDLGLLSDDEAWQLLSGHLGAERVTAERAAVAELLSVCGGLPLALGIVAARAATHPDFPLAVLAAELRDHSERLDGLDTGDGIFGLRSVFSWSVRALSADAEELFGLLGLAPGPDINQYAVAALTGHSFGRAGVLLRELESAHLVSQPAPGRYRMHDLVRLYAAERAQGTAEEPLLRLADFYVHTANIAETLLYPQKRETDFGEPIEGVRTQPLTDDSQALAWFDAEYACLYEVQRFVAARDWHLYAWRMARATETYQFRKGLRHARVEFWEAAAKACEHLDGTKRRLQAERGLADAYARIGEHTKAMDQLRRALSVAEELGEVPSQGHINYSLAAAWERHGDDQRALEHALRALEVYGTLDRPVWTAQGNSACGWFHARLGNNEQARPYLERALAIYREIDHRDGQAGTLDSLGLVAYDLGDMAEAIDCFAHSVKLFREIGNTYYEPEILERLGKAQLAAGHDDDAREAWQLARDSFRAQGRPDDADRVRELLAGSGLA